MPTKISEMPTNMTELLEKPRLLLKNVRHIVSGKECENMGEDLRNLVDGVLNVENGQDRTDLEVRNDISYNLWLKANHEVRKQYLINMCHAVWMSEDVDKKSQTITAWIRRLNTEKMSSTLMDDSQNPEEGTYGAAIDGGNRKNKTRKSKTRRNKTRRNKTRRNKTRRNKTRKNKKRYSKTRKNKRR